MAAKKKAVWHKILLGLVLLVLAARIAAPYVIQSAVNSRLRRIPEYTGSVGAIHLSVIRGAYQLRDVRIIKRQGDPNEPFVAAKLIDFSLAWRKLFRGQLVSDIYAEDMTLTFFNSSTKESSELQPDKRWQDVIQDLFPIDITRCKINRGVLRYVDISREPKVDIAIHDLQIVATGLRNRQEKKTQDYPSSVSVNGTVLGSGHINIEVQLEPLAAQPHFQGKLDLTKVELTQLDDLLRAYGHVDVSSGRLQLYLEAKASGGEFDGYIKPFFEDLHFTNDNVVNDNLGKRIWQTLVSGLAKLVTNHQRGQVATQIPFSGRFGQPDVGVLATISNLFKNAFGHALSETFNTDKLQGEKKPEKLSDTKG